MPRVLRIINRFNLGGPTFNAALLTKHLPGEFETLLVGGRKEDHEDSSLFILDELGVEPVIVEEMERSLNWSKDRKALKKLREIIREFKPDIVHTHASKAGALGRLAASKENVPVILHTFHGHVFHSYFGPLKTSFYKRVERYLAAKSTAIIAISEIQKKELCNDYKICKHEKVEVIPLGFDLNRFREAVAEKRFEFRNEIGAEEGDIVISIVGRMVPIKDHKLFLESVTRVKKSSRKSLKVVLAGDGELFDELVSLGRSLGWTVSTPDRIDRDAEMHFLSWRKDIDVIYSGSDIVALSSLNEGTPVSLIEAQAADKPIVCTDVGGVRDIVGKSAAIVPPGDLEGFTKELLALVESKDLRQQRSLGWEEVRNRFHYERLVKDMSALYNKLLSSKGTE